VLLLALAVFCGVAVLFVVGVGNLHEEYDARSITDAEYASVKTGPRGNTRKRIAARFGATVEVSRAAVPGEDPPGTACIFYNRKGQFSVYRFCFDNETGRLRVKSHVIPEPNI